jgi:hypothetical protein
MNIHIDEDIQEMLYEGGTVIIPGLGAFRGGYKSAYIDGIQGHLAPPSLDITFDPNTVINDGVFVDFLKKKYTVSVQEAQAALDDFRDRAYSTFEKHELIVIPQVGRLYRDFNLKVQFLPDATNFNTDTFGLPTAQFHPVSRTTGEKTAAVEAIKNDTPPPPITTKSFPETTTNIPFPATIQEEVEPVGGIIRWRKFMPGLTVAVLAILAFSIYMHNRNKGKAVPNPVPTIEQPNVNVSPNQPIAETPTDNIVAPIAVPPPATKPNKTIAHPKMVEKPKNTEGATDIAVTPPITEAKTNKARIICGAYGDVNNINRHKKWFTANGYGVYEKQRGNIFVLGADVQYSDKQDLKRIMAKLVERFGASAVQIQK